MFSGACVIDSTSDGLEQDRQRGAETIAWYCMYVSIVSIKALPIVYGQSLLMLGPGLLFVLGRSHQSPTEPLRTLQTLFRWQASNLFSSTHSCLVLRAYDCRRWCIAKSVQKCECLARNKSLHRFASLCIALMRHAAKAISKGIKTYVLCFCTESESMREPCVVWVDADVFKAERLRDQLWRTIVANDAVQNLTQIIWLVTDSYDPLALPWPCLGHIWSRWSTYTTLFPMWACKTSDWRRVAPFSLLTSLLSLKLWQISIMQCCHFLSLCHLGLLMKCVWQHSFDNPSQSGWSIYDPSRSIDSNALFIFNGFQWISMDFNGIQWLFR